MKKIHCRFEIHEFVSLSDGQQKINMNLLITEHHITVIAFDGLDFSMSRIDMPFQMIGFHKRGTTF